MVLVDLWLFSVKDVFVNQLVLIGEVMLWEKYVEFFDSYFVVDFDWFNLCFMGSVVVSGYVMVVVLIIGYCIVFGYVVNLIVV